MGGFHLGLEFEVLEFRVAIRADVEQVGAAAIHHEDAVLHGENAGFPLGGGVGFPVGEVLCR